MHSISKPTATASKSWAILAAYFAFSATPALAADFWWRGQLGNNWNTISSGNTNFATDSTGLTARTSLPTSSDNIRFAASGATNLNTTIFSTFSFNALTLEPTLTSDVSIGLTSSTALFPRSGGITNNSNHTLTISAGIGIDLIALNVNTATGPVLITQRISGFNSSLTKTGNSTLTLTSNNALTVGSTTVSAGTLQIGNGGTTGSVTGNITNNANVVFNRSNDSTHSSNISGTGSITKLGAGTLTLTSSLTHTGGTTVAAGALQIGNGTSSGSISGNITNNSSLQFNPSSSSSFTGIISGSGTVTKLGTATLSLTGNSTYTGDTIVSQGTLAIGDFFSSNSTTGSIAGNIINNANLAFNRSNNHTHSGAISGTGNLIKLGNGTLTLTGVNTFTGTTTLSTGTLLAESPSSLPGFDTPGKILINTGTTLAVRANAADGQWNQTNIDSLRSSASFSSSDARLGIDTTLGNFTYNSSISGQFGLTKLGTNTLILTGSNTNTGSITISGGTLQIGDGGNTGSITSAIVNNAQLTFNRSDDTTNASNTSGTGSLTKLGSNTLTLAGNQTYSGTTNIVDGTLLITGSKSGTGPTTLTTGILQIGNGGTTGSYAGSITNNSSVILNRSDNFTFSANTSGVGSLTKLGAGAVTIEGNLNHTGETTVSEGTFIVGDGNALGFITGNITNKSLLVFNQVSSSSYAASISGSGSFEKRGSSTLTLKGINTFTGTTTISRGTLVAESPSTLPGYDTPGKISVSAGAALAIGVSTSASQWTESQINTLLSNVAFSPDSQLGFDTTNGNITYNSELSGSTTLLKRGPNTLILTADHTYSGKTLVTDGTLQLGNGGNTGSVPGNIELVSLAGPRTVIFNRSDDVTYSHSISGGGTLTKLGNNKLTLTGNNTFIGTTTFSSGILQIGNGGTTGTLSSAIVNNSELIVNRSGDVDLFSISGTGSLTKLGDGTLSLTSTNTHTGITRVTAGTLSIGKGNSAGSLTGHIVNDAEMVFNRFDNYTHSGNISGTGNLTKLGNNVLTLTGTLSYSGTTTVSAGILIAEMPSSLPGYDTPGRIIVNSGATLAVRAGTAGNQWDESAINTLRSSATFASNANLGIDTSLGNFNYNTGITGPMGLVKLGTNTLTLTSNNTNSVNTIISSGTLQIGNGGTSGSLTGNIINNASLHFNRSDTQTFSPDISGTGAVTKFGANTLILTGNISHSGGTVVSAGTLQVGNGGSTGSITGNITTNASLVFNSSADFTNTGVISGSGSLTKLGAGTVILTGNNTYIGGTTVSTGTLQIGNGGSTGSFVGNVLVQNGANFAINRSNNVFYSGSISGPGSFTKLGSGTLTLTATNSHTGGTIISAGNLTIGNGTSIGPLLGNITNNAALTFNTSGGASFSGVITGTGTLSIIGNTSLSLSGNNTFTGTTTITSGSLSIVGNAGSLVGNITNNSLLSISRSGTFTYPGNISGGGRLEKFNSGTLILTGTNTFTGTTTLFDGILQIGNGGATGSITGSIINNASLIVNRSNDIGLSGDISGSGSLTKLGAGTLTLFGSNSYTGSTTVSAGKLEISGSGGLGTNSISLANNATLAFNRNSDLSFPGSISGNGSLTKLGTGTFTLTGSTTYTGTTAISAGTLAVGIISSSSITNNGNLIINATQNFSYPGIISGSGNLTKQDNNLLVLTNTNSYTGTTTISQGTFQIGNGGLTGSISNSNIIVNSQLSFNRANNFGHNGNISGLGSLTKLGPGTLTLSGNNTYTGSTTLFAGGLVMTKPFTTGSTIDMVGQSFLELASGGSTLLQTTNLKLGTFGSLITNDNDLIVNYTGLSPLAILRESLNSGRIIDTSSLSGIPTQLVLFEAADLALTQFAGLPIDSTTVIGKFTYAGDANLDDQVNAFDYSKIDDNFGKPGTFITGDLNGDGIINSLDYCIIDDTLGAGVNTPLRPAAFTEVFIPEPTSLALLALPGLLLSRRKR